MNSTATQTKADPRVFSITLIDNQYRDTTYRLKEHTLHVREWGLEAIADTGEITGYPWSYVRTFTLGHIA